MYTEINKLFKCYFFFSTQMPFHTVIAQRYSTLYIKDSTSCDYIYTKNKGLNKLSPNNTRSKMLISTT